MVGISGHRHPPPGPPPADPRRADGDHLHHRAPRRSWWSGPARCPGWRGRTSPPASPRRSRYEWRESRAPTPGPSAERGAAPAHRASTWWPTTGGSSGPCCGCWPSRAAGSRWCPAGPPPPRRLALKPDGVFLTNGPGDPAAVVGRQGDGRRRCSGKVPIFGICLGHQILSLAIGARTYKLKFGHRGANQPVQGPGHRQGGHHRPEPRLRRRRRSRWASARASPTVNLNDGTVEGIEVLDAPAFSVQYHPESPPGSARRPRALRPLRRDDGAAAR